MEVLKEAENERERESQEKGAMALENQSTQEGLQKEIDALQEDLKEITELQGGLKIEKDKVAEERNARDKEVKVLEQEMIVAEKKRDAAVQASQNDLRKKEQESEERLMVAEDQFNKQLKRKEEAFEKAANGRAKETNSLKAQVAKLEKKCTELTEELVESKAACLDIQEKWRNSLKNMKQINMRESEKASVEMEAHTNEVSELNQRVNGLENDLSKSVAAVKQLTDRESELLEELSHLRSSHRTRELEAMFDV